MNAIYQKYQVEILDKFGKTVWEDKLSCKPETKNITELFNLHTGLIPYSIEQDNEVEDHICFDCETNGGYHIINFFPTN